MKRWLIHGSLFVATFFTATTFLGPIYAATIMTILLAHELGHYCMCKKYGVAATFPIFIPMPNILGTLGAVITMKSPIPNRKALFDIGIAGPLVGLAFAIPALVIGLLLSEVKELPKDAQGLFLGEPLLFTWLSDWIVGPIPESHDIFLHPIAFAGWAALFVTSINLFPIGQLDGGHMLYAMLGIQARKISWLAVAALAFLGIQFEPMWFFFMALILIFVFRHPAPIDDQTPISLNRWKLAIFTYVLMALCFSPVPFDFRFSPP